MRTWSGLFDKLLDPDFIDRAAAQTVRGKRRRPEVAWFLFRKEAILAELLQRLRVGTYRPGSTELIRIRDPKPRLIARVPIVDRIVQTAIVMALEPVLTVSLRPEAFACRPGLGTHRAVLKLLELMRRFRFALHLDIRSYFPSIDRQIVRSLLRRRVRDERLLALVDLVLAGSTGLYTAPTQRAFAGLTDDWPPMSRGLAIGAYTSQVFAAHLYLEALDHWVKRELKVRGYLRYVDDIFLFANRRGELRRARAATALWLERERGLRLKHPQARVLSCCGSLDALGYRVTRHGLRVRRRVLQRLATRVRQQAYRGRVVPKGSFERSVAATVGLALF